MTLRGAVRNAAFFAAAWFVPRPSAAQGCCGRVDLPVAASERPGARRGHLVLGTQYEYAFLDDGLIEQGYGIESSHAHVAALDASYGVTSWLAPAVLVPYVYKFYEWRIGGAAVSRSTQGLGDVALLVRAAVWGPRALAPGAPRVWVGPGVKFPTGEWKDRDRFGPLAASAQVGSGAWEVLGGLHASIGLAGPASRALIVGAVLYRHTTENGRGYRFGDAVLGSADLVSSHFLPVALRGGVVIAGAGADRQYSVALDNTGGVRWLARAGAAYYVRPELSVGADVRIPFLASVRGEQLDPRVSVVAGLTYEAAL